MRQATKLADIMTENVVAVRADQSLAEAITLLLQHNVSCLPVIDDECNLIGVVTEYDLINFALSGELNRTAVREAMSERVISFPPDADFESLVNYCMTNRIHRVPIVNGGKLVGIVSRRDILRVIRTYYGAP